MLFVNKEVPLSVIVETNGGDDSRATRIKGGSTANHSPFILRE